MNKIYLFAFILFFTKLSYAQPPSPSVIQGRLPKGTTIHGNIPYNADTAWARQLMDSGLTELTESLRAKPAALASGLRMSASAFCAARGMGGSLLASLIS